MPWAIPTLRQRRQQVRDTIATALPGADASVPNSALRVMGDAQAALTHDNDQHLGWVARMMMPDTAEGEFLERWAAIWLPNGRKPATRASGALTVTGTTGAAVPLDTHLTATVYDAAGTAREIVYRVAEGRTLSGSSAVVPVEAITAGALGNLDEGARVAFVTPPAGIDGQATVAAPGLAGGADIEIDRDLSARMIDRIQQPPHGGSRNDYVQWALDVPGVTRAWAAQEMGPGTVTVRIMLDQVRAAANGVPEPEDLDLVHEMIDALRPVTVGSFWVLAPTPQPLDLNIENLASDTPATRSAVKTEVAAMLMARAAPGRTIYASWVREAVSNATGEDHHELTISNIVPASAGHLIVPGLITFT